jgi:SSS family transporter
MRVETVNWLDWVVLCAYGLALAGISIHHARKLRAQDDFFLAGRSMRRWPIALSMYVALFSTNSFLGVTGWVNRRDGTIWVGLLQVGVIAAVPLVVALYPEIFFRLRITTAYEYLEQRFAYPVRGFAAVFFLGARVMWLSTMIYAAALVVCRMTGWENIQSGIFAIGLFGMFLAMAGGMHAVIWTDVLQFFVLFGGVAVMLTLSVMQAGGPAEVIRAGLEAGKFSPPPLFSLTEELSIAAALAAGVFSYLSSAGADQVVLQTYLSAKSAAEAKKSLIRNGLFLKPLSLIYPVLGLVLFAWFRTHPAEAALMRSTDDAVPVFVVQAMPAGVRGLIIAAILSAVLTSVESGLSALSACVQVDFIRRFRRTPLADRAAVLLARGLVLAWGVAVVLGALVVQQLGQKNNILQLLNLLMYPFSSVLLGVFLLGLLTRRANSPGTLTGAVAGFALTIALASYARLSTFYTASLGALLTFSIGYAASLLFPVPQSRQLEGLSHRAPARDAAEPAR